MGAVFVGSRLDQTASPMPAVAHVPLKCFFFSSQWSMRGDTHASNYMSAPFFLNPSQIAEKFL